MKSSLWETAHAELFDKGLAPSVTVERGYAGSSTIGRRFTGISVLLATLCGLQYASRAPRTFFFGAHHEHKSLSAKNSSFHTGVGRRSSLLANLCARACARE